MQGWIWRSAVTPEHDFETGLEAKAAKEDAKLEKLAEIQQALLASLQNPAASVTSKEHLNHNDSSARFRGHVIIDWKLVLVLVLAAQMKHLFG